MKADIRLPWIKSAYTVFAYEGPHGLKIERLAAKTGKNKSSFYHLFSSIDLFTDDLLAYHIRQAERMAEKEAASSSLEELIEIILDHKIDLLFSRQLRIHRENPDFERCFVKTNELTGPAIIGVWAQILDLQDNSFLAELVLKLSLENFFIQLTDETLNREWLHHYFSELQALVRALRTKASNAPIKR